MAKRLHPILRSFLEVIKGLAETLGPDYEVVLHDISNPERSIVAIENGHVTGRTVGGPLTDLGLYLLNSDKFKNVNYLANYLTEVNGKKIRSTTIFIRDEEKKVIGFLCINYDMTKDEILKTMVEQLTNVEEISLPFTHGTERFPSRIDELLSHELKNAQRMLGKPLKFATKDERVRLVKCLNDNGFFLLKGSVDILANEMGISKFTLYSYIRKVRENKGKRTRNSR